MNTTFYLKCVGLDSTSFLIQQSKKTSVNKSIYFDFAAFVVKAGTDAWCHKNGTWQEFFF